MEFPRVWESPQKIKNLNLIKIAKNGDRAKRKLHKSFFVFFILDLKTLPNDAELNSAPGRGTHFLKNKRVWYLEKQPNLKKLLKITKKRPLAPKGSRPAYGGT